MGTDIQEVLGAVEGMQLTDRCDAPPCAAAKAVLCNGKRQRNRKASSSRVVGASYIWPRSWRRPSTRPVTGIWARVFVATAASLGRGGSTSAITVITTRRKNLQCRCIVIPPSSRGQGSQGPPSSISARCMPRVSPSLLGRDVHVMFAPCCRSRRP